MRRSIKKSLVFFFLLMLTTTIFFGSVASAKSVAVKRSSFNKSESTMSGRAATVKSGTTTLNLKSSTNNKDFCGTIKFNVSKSGNYSFSFSEFKQDGNKNVKGTIMLWKPSSGKLKRLSFTTDGGKTNLIKIATKSQSGSVTTGKYLKKRTATLSLKKGEVIYFSIKFPGKSKATMKFQTKCSTSSSDTDGSSSDKANGTSDNSIHSGAVYYTPTGKKYHSTKKCSSLSRSRVIYSTTVSGAVSKGLDPCKLCH